MQYNDQFRPFRHNCSSLSGFEVPRRRGQPICGLAGPRGARAVRSSAPAGVCVGGASAAECACARACKVIASVTHFGESSVESGEVAEQSHKKRGLARADSGRATTERGAGNYVCDKRGQGQSCKVCKVTASLYPRESGATYIQSRMRRGVRACSV